MRWGLRVIISNALQSMLERCSGSETIMLVTHRVLYNYLFDYFAVEARNLMIAKVPYCSVTELTLNPEKAEEPLTIIKTSKDNNKEAVFCKRYNITQLCNASHLDPNDEHNKNHTTVTL
jgi:broad specificity phosphatase PhoE